MPASETHAKEAHDARDGAADDADDDALTAIERPSGGSAGAQCPDENVLGQYAEHALADDDAAARVSAHLQTCADCRAVLAGALRAAPPPSSAPWGAEAGDDGAHATPVDILHQYLADEAPARERLATGFVALLSAATLAAFLVVHFTSTPVDARVLAALALPLACAAPMNVALRRGFYRSWVPLADTLVEVLAAYAIYQTIALVVGPDVLAQSPGLLAWPALLVFSAVRANPRASLAAGALSAALSMLLWASAPPADLAGLSSAVRAAVRSLVLLGSGVGGAMLARYLVNRAERALRLAREQDLMGRYVLHERIGAGGMAEVFAATYCPEGGFRKRVAVKRVLPEWSGDERFAAAFLEEARLGALLAHPNIVQVLDCGRFRDAFILSMELVDGLSLASLLRRAPRRRLTAQAVAYAGAELCAALDYIHRRHDADGRPLHLVHRDVNPANVLLSRAGEVKLSDFGVAHASSRAAVGERDAFYGKEAYAAPEQRERGPIDGRTDLYALGLTLQEALAGVGSAGDDGDATRAALAQLIAQLTAAAPDARPAEASAVRAELLALAGASGEGKAALIAAIAASAQTQPLTPSAQPH